VIWLAGKNISFQCHLNHIDDPLTIKLACNSIRTLPYYVTLEPTYLYFNCPYQHHLASSYQTLSHTQLHLPSLFPKSNCQFQKRIQVPCHQSDLNEMKTLRLPHLRIESLDILARCFKTESHRVTAEKSNSYRLFCHTPHSPDSSETCQTPLKLTRPYFEYFFSLPSLERV
jgi:hypothetical protein